MSRYVFGPVPSRRLGRSLGIDLVPYKTCTYDCIYCQLGKTTNLTRERREWVPQKAVLEEIRKKLANLKGIDFLTFSGSGEPTLHIHIGRLIRELKKQSTVPVAVLTNGSLLWQREVQDDLQAADLVIPSLDAPDERLFRHVNRPHPDLVFEKVLEGLIRFRERYQGTIWLEVFLLAGMTGMESEVKKLANLTRSIKPDLVQILTVTRPPQEEFAEPVSSEQMRLFSGMFDVPAVVVSASGPVSEDVLFSEGKEQILELLGRRPCTIKEIALGLGMARAEAGKYIENLFARGEVRSLTCNGKTYYRADPR